MLFLPSISLPRRLCLKTWWGHYYNNAINEVSTTEVTPVWHTHTHTHSLRHTQQVSIFYVFIYFGYGGKINKWWSNTVYANLISHASYVPPRFFGSTRLRLRGKWQRRGLICLISSVMIMWLSTLFVTSTKGHMNKRRFEVEVRMIRRTFWANLPFPRLIQWIH